MHLFGHEHGVVAGDVLVEQVLDKLDRLGLGDVQMAVVEHQLGDNGLEAGRMRGRIDFGDDGNAVVEHPLLVGAVIFLGVEAVGRGQALDVAFQPEDEVAVFTDVVDMQMNLVELEISVIFGNFLDVCKRQVGARDVDHPAADGIIGVVPRPADGHEAVRRERLHRRDEAVEQPLRLGRDDGQAGRGGVHKVPVRAERIAVRIVQLQHDVAVLGGRGVVGRMQLQPEQLPEIAAGNFHLLFQRRIAGRIYNRGICGRDIAAYAALPFADGGDDRRRRVDLVGGGNGYRAEQHRRAKGREQKTFHNGDLPIQKI